MAPRRPPTILTLAQGWDSSKGGVATFNRQLSIGLAETGYLVTARVASAAGLTHPMVSISETPSVPGIDDDRAWLLNPAGLPPRVDVLIGHSRFSGGPAAVLQSTLYPQARRIHFLHTSPEHLGRLQKHPEAADRNAATERQLMAGADLVVGVGPLLAEEARRLARQSTQLPPPVHELIPGIVARSVPAYPPAGLADRRVHLLLFGRANEPLKGAVEAAHIVRALADRGFDPQLTIRGATAAEAGAQERDLSQRAGRPVWVKPFTADPHALDQDLRGTDLVIVAALHEDFGLVATEAAGAGVPLLVGSHTGAGQFLSNPTLVPEALGAPCVVPDRSTNVELWADRAQQVLESLPAVRLRAAELRDHLTTTFTWERAGAKMMGTLSSTPARQARPRGRAAARALSAAAPQRVQSGRVETTPDKPAKMSPPSPVHHQPRAR